MLTKIKKVVDQNPNKIVYKVNKDSITYKELWDSANHYAELLKKQGTSPVIIYGHKEISVIISILACLIANRPYVPVGSCTPYYRLKKIIDMTNATLILTEQLLKIDNVCCNKLEELEQYNNNEELEQTNEIAYIIFTSGSTGEPKGVPISKSNLNNFINWICNLKPLCDYKSVNVLNQASFSFDLSVADLYYSLCNGHTLIALDNDIQNDYVEVFELIKNINVAVITPTFIKLCLINKNFNEQNFPNLKCLYFCGEQLEVKPVRKLFELFPNLKIINAYGPTEATSAISAIRITKDMANNLKLLPVGDTNNLATDVEIIDDEIVLKGKSVFNGYLSNISGGYYNENGINCYKTGDIGYIENNLLYCKGRKDNQVKYKGYRIELNEIENNINLIDGIKECVVVAKYSDDSIVKTIKAFIVAEKNIDVSYIRKELNKFLPLYMIPKVIKIIDKIPINNNGKIDRKALVDL